MIKIPKPLAVAAGILALVGVAFPVLAASYIYAMPITPDAPDGWAPVKVEPGGTYKFVSDTTAPFGTGALELKTDATDGASVGYGYAFDMMGYEISWLGDTAYSMKQVAGGGRATMQLSGNLDSNIPVDLVFDPADQSLYGSQAITPGEWQEWDVDAGYLRIVPRNGATVSLDTTQLYTFPQILAAYPYAMMYNMNIVLGPDAPSTTVAVDGVVWGSVARDFEQGAVAEEPVDLIPPVATIITPTELTSAKGDLVVTGTITDDVRLSVYSISIYDMNDVFIAGSGVLPAAGTSMDVTHTFNSAQIPDGNYVLKLETIDGSGNQDPTISIDKLAFAIDNIIDTKDACKDTGWETLTMNQKFFKNQGQCVSYFNSLSS